jgi:hypothetical protein
MVQQVNGETQGKWLEESPMIPNPNNATGQVNTSTLVNVV